MYFASLWICLFSILCFSSLFFDWIGGRFAAFDFRFIRTSFRQTRALFFPNSLTCNFYLTAFLFAPFSVLPSFFPFDSDPNTDHNYESRFTRNRVTIWHHPLLPVNEAMITQNRNGKEECLSLPLSTHSMLCQLRSVLLLFFSTDFRSLPSSVCSSIEFWDHTEGKRDEEWEKKGREERWETSSSSSQQLTSHSVSSLRNTEVRKRDFECLHPLCCSSFVSLSLSTDLVISCRSWNGGHFMDPRVSESRSGVTLTWRRNSILLFLLLLLDTRSSLLIRSTLIIIILPLSSLFSLSSLHRNTKEKEEE